MDAHPTGRSATIGDAGGVSVAGKPGRLKHSPVASWAARAPARSLLALATVSPVALFFGATALLQPAWAETCTPGDTTTCSAPGGVGSNSPRGGNGGAGNGGGGNGVGFTGSTVQNPGGTGGNGAGGSGGAGDGGPGGAGGLPTISQGGSGAGTTSHTGGTGANGSAGFNRASGGGGGGAAVYFYGTSYGFLQGGGTSIRGGAGGAGGAATSGAVADAGGGGGGGAGVISIAASTILSITAPIIGGDGGAGGAGGFGGSGGGGGDGLLVIGSLTSISNSGSITGGVGGSGGSGLTVSGNAGNSGRGVNLVGLGTTLTNSGTIAGGAANGGDAGIGIVTSGNDTIRNSGTISGGLIGGASYATAILFGGTGNRLELQTGSTIRGDIVVGASAGATIAAQNGGLTLDNAIVLGSGSGLTFDTGLASLSVSGAVSGAGSLTVTGGNRLVLSGVNTYTGGTTLAGGTLSAATDANLGAASGGLTFTGGILSATASFATSRTITLTGAGGFDISGGLTALTLDGAISGSGGLTKLGAGRLVLTGTNTYAGGTTITAGSLQVGNGGTAGSIVGDVVNNGTLLFNRSGVLTLAGAVSGTGTLHQLGTGSITLAGINSYSGGTLIALGSLIGTARSFGSGQITNFGALVIDQPTDAGFANTIIGSGSLTKRGAGNLTLTGVSPLTGATTVEAGTLSVNGALASSAVTVLSGATLGGSGTVGATTIRSGGTIAPGNSIGTLTVNGNLVLAPGSIYQVEIAGNGTSDRIAASGSATIAGSQVGVTALDPQTSYLTGQRYTIITATGGVSGTMVGAVSHSAFLDLAVEHRSNQVELVIQVKGGPSPDTGPSAIAPPSLFETVARTRNQFATAVALDTLPQAGGTLALYNGILMLDAASARQAFDQLSGEIHASAKTALVDESWLLRSAVNDRLRSAHGAVGAARMSTMNYGFASELAPGANGPMPKPGSDRFAVWGQGYGSWGRSDADGNAAKLTRSTGGFLIGADAAVFDALRFGVIAGYSRSAFDVKGRLSSGESDNYHLGLYAGGQWGALGLRTGASYTWHDVSTRRSVAFSGFSDRLTSDSNAGTAQIFGELGYRLDLGSVALEPFAGLAYVNLHTDGLRETGGAAALSARSDDTGIGYSTLGLRAATTTQLQGMALILRGGLAWRHAFGDVDPVATLAFAGSGSFSVAGLPIASDAALVEAGLDLAISQSAMLGLSYTGQLAEDAQDHAFKGVLAVRF